MSTTSGNMKTFKVTDPHGNQYIMIPVDTEARQAIDEAKNLQFDENHFKAEESQDGKDVNISLNEIGLEVDTTTPLQAQVSNDAVKLGVDSVFSETIAAPYTNKTYSVGDIVTYKGYLYECNTEISTAEDWTAAHWTKIIVKDLSDAAKAVADEAAQAIEGAKDLTFDEDFFTPDETDTEVNVSLNGVPFGVDDETPLQILQDTQDGIVIGADSPFNSAIASTFDGTIAYKVNDRVIYKGKLYRCTTAIVTPTSAWDPSNWTETSVDEEIDAIDAVTDVIITSADNSTISFVTNGVADLTPLYTYIKDLEDRVAALEAAQGSKGIIVNGVQPTVNGNTITVGE